MYDPRYDEPSYDEASEDEGPYDGANYDEGSYDQSAYDEALDDEDEPQARDDEDEPRDDEDGVRDSDDDDEPSDGDEPGDDDDEPASGDDEDGPREFHFQSRNAGFVTRIHDDEDEQSRSAGRTRLHHNNQEVLPKKKALVLGIIGSVVPHDQREEGATISAHTDARDVRQVLIGDFSPLHLQTFIFDYF